MDDWIVIANPTAGRGRCARGLPAALAALAERGVRAEVLTTEHAGDGVRLAGVAHERGYRRVLVAGGEGTVNEVLNGLAKTNALGEHTLGTIPLGTGNSFLADFGLQDVGAAVERIAAGDASPCDAMACEFDAGGSPRWVLNNVLFGFGADVGDLMNRRLKPLGTFGYTAGVLVELARFRRRRFSIHTDAGEVSGEYAIISVANSQYTGGNMQISPGALVDDGLLDAVTVGSMSRIGLLRAFPLVFRGAHLDHPKVDLTRTQRVRVESDVAVPVLVDGDVAGVTPVTVTVFPAALQVIR